MRSNLVLCATLALSLSGCFLDHSPPETPIGPVEIPAPPPEMTVTVDASISGATLGDDCATDSGAGIAGDCDGDCSAFCQQSNVQLAISTSAGDVDPLVFEVVRVTLHDFESGDAIEDLTPRNPRVWAEDVGYEPWAERLPAPSELSTTYDLSAPSWGSMSERGFDVLYSRPFQIRMDVRIDGEPRTLESGELYRVSDIDT